MFKIQKLKNHREFLSICISGKRGSGKTFFAVNFIHRMFSAKEIYILDQRPNKDYDDGFYTGDTFSNAIKTLGLNMDFRLLDNKELSKKLNHYDKFVLLVDSSTMPMQSAIKYSADFNKFNTRPIKLVVISQKRDKLTYFDIHIDLNNNLTHRDYFDNGMIKKLIEMRENLKQHILTLMVADLDSINSYGIPDLYEKLENLIERNKPIFILKNQIPKYKELITYLEILQKPHYEIVFEIKNRKLEMNYK